MSSPNPSSSSASPVAPLEPNSLECIVCSDTFRKLKLLTCGHSFCTTCLERIERGGSVRCPYCRQTTELPVLGVGDLPGQFTGQLMCSECQGVEDMKETRWCNSCKLLLCRECTSTHNSGHRTEPTNDLGPVRFCMQQLDKFCAIHTKLTVIQKSLIKEYVHQLGEALERQLDDELTNRIHRLKAEKALFRDVFDTDAAITQAVPGPHPQASLPVTPTIPRIPNDAKFAHTLSEIYKMSPTSLQDRVDLGELPRNGLIFNPLPLKETVDMFFKTDRFATFSGSMAHLRQETAVRVPQNYIGAGILDDPCDLCALPEKNMMVVTCIRKGLYCFKLTTGELIRVAGPTLKANGNVDGNSQFVGICYEPKHKLFLVSVLKEYQDWYIQLYDQRLKMRQEIACPKEPVISNSWYRWLTTLTHGRVLMSSGDQHVSVLWLLDLNANRWRELVVREGVTFRRAAFSPNPKAEQRQYLYVPDMQSRTICTFILNTDTWQIVGSSEIVTAELSEEMPIMAEMCNGTLLVGNWHTGKIILADLSKCKSQLLTNVGPKQLFSSCVFNSKLAVLCKRKEMVEIYSLKVSREP